MSKKFIRIRFKFNGFKIFTGYKSSVYNSSIDTLSNAYDEICLINDGIVNVFILRGTKTRTSYSSLLESDFPIILLSYSLMFFLSLSIIFISTKFFVNLHQLFVSSISDGNMTYHRLFHIQ